MPNSSKTFVVWPKNIDQSFRKSYETLTGEHITKPTRQNMSETLNMVGSNRILPEHIEILSEKFKDVIFTDTPPKYWVEYIPPEFR